MKIKRNNQIKFEKPINFLLVKKERSVIILDKLEALVNDLTSGISVEIAALQEQYEYYRNKLLTFQRTA